MQRLDRQIDLRRLPQATVIGAVIGVLVNLVIYGVARAARLEFRAPVPPTNEPMPLPVIAVITATVVSAIGAALVLALFSRFTAQPLRIFLVCAAVVLVISFAGPLRCRSVCLSRWC